MESKCVTWQEPALSGAASSRPIVHDFLTSSRKDLESAFIKAEDNETKEGLRVEEATGEILRHALLWLPKNIMGKT